MLNDIYELSVYIMFVKLKKDYDMWMWNLISENNLKLSLKAMK